LEQVKSIKQIKKLTFKFSDFVYFVAQQIFWARPLLGSFTIYTSKNKIIMDITPFVLERRMAVRMVVMRAHLAHARMAEIRPRY
jgi:hypothetical protein